MPFPSCAGATRKKQRVERRSIDLTAYPDLVVIYLGTRINTLRGIRTVIALGLQIGKSAAAQRDGLLLHEQIISSLRHIGTRQFWRDFASLERWFRSAPHREW